MSKLSQLGLTDKLRQEYEKSEADFSNLARVIREHKELYAIQNTEGEYAAEITGNMRFAAASREDFPAVGDWVEASVFDGGQAIIHKIHERLSQLERQSVGSYGEKQLIATNIDIAFIVQAVDRDFNLNRLERYFVLAHNGHIEPVVVLNKADLAPKEQLDEIKQQVRDRLHTTSVFMTSTLTGAGLNELETFLIPGKTYCLIGSSGVGKSSIINYLIGEEKLLTKNISDATNKGKHTTTHRELIQLKSGAILIDTPGMREVGMTEHASGVEMTFEDITALARECKFADCTHEDEPGCKVLEAIEEGALSIEELENYKKLERQSAHFSSTIAEKRKRDKSFGKMVKEVIKNKKNSKY